MNIRKLEDLTKEELIELVKHEGGTKYTDGYISGYMVACNFAASLASEAWVNHVFHTGLDGLIERCKNMEHVLLEEAQACRAQGHGYVLSYPLAMIPEGWKLVPVEPTDEMKKAGCQVPLNKAVRHNTCYKAMLTAAPTVKKSLTVEPTDSEMWDWLIKENCSVLKLPFRPFIYEYKVFDSHGDVISVGETAREAITKAMRGEE